jgi:hypothetical protein
MKSKRQQQQALPMTFAGLSSGRAQRRRCDRDAERRSEIDSIFSKRQAKKFSRYTFAML